MEGKASYEDIDGSSIIIIESNFYKREPVYRVEFLTGRNKRFFIQGSETFSKSGI